MRRSIALLAALLLAGCADTAYYWQSVSGHLRLMQAARPVGQWLASDQTPTALRQQLQLAQAMRRFAVTTLHLPDNASYQRFAELPRRYVVWNVVAAPALSLTLTTWCFAVVGCVGYRGYFDEAQAHQLAATLRDRGLEVSVYGVPAYSTLGWLNWAGGDPLLSTFIHHPEGQLAGLMFHELAHQVLYVKDDTAFNESFATAVERLGAQAWLDLHGTAQARLAYTQAGQRRAQFQALTRHTRTVLQQIYMQNQPVAPVPTAQVAMKNRAMADFRRAYAELKIGWGGYSGYDTWVAQANNAAFGALAAYDALVPGFLALFVYCGRDWQRFFEAARQLGLQPAQQRATQLQHWAQEQHLG